MDAQRLARIRDRLLHAEHRLGLFMEWHTAAEGDIKDRLACYKALQEGAEALADAAALIVKGLGLVPHDDYGNYAALHQAGVISDRSLALLNELNGLRNALVHDYANLDDTRALEAGERLVPNVIETVEEVDAWLSSRN